MIKIKHDGYSIPTIIVLGFMMFLNLNFFIISRNQGLGKAAGVVMTGVLLALFVLMLYSGNIARYRRIFFGMAAFMFVPTFIAILVEQRGSMYIASDTTFKNETPMCHIVFTMSMIPYLLKQVLIFPAKISNYFASFYSMLIYWIVASLAFGRGWCSWVCFYGGWEDSISRLSGKTRVPIHQGNNKVRYFGFVILIFVILASLPTMTAVYCEWLCPFRIVTEFPQVTGFRTIIIFIIMVLIFFGLVIVLPFLTRKRFQCMTFCPFGAMQSLVGKISFYKVRIDSDRCIKCKKCVNVCPTMSLSDDSIESKSGKPLMTCTMCGECMKACPVHAIDYTFCGQKKPIGGFIELKHNHFRKSTGIYGRMMSSVFRMLSELLSPRALFIFVAYTFGMIITSGFEVATIHRFLNLVINGSFLIK